MKHPHHFVDTAWRVTSRPVPGEVDALPTHTPALLLALSCAALTGCESGGTEPLSTSETVTVAALLSEFSDAHDYHGRFAWTGEIPMVLATIPVADDCVYDGARLSFVCPPVTRAGITSNISFQLLDASGVPQSAFSPTSTAAIRVVGDIAGHAQLPPEVVVDCSTNFDSYMDKTLSGLLTGQRTLSGSAVTTADLTGICPRTISRIVETTVNLVLPPRGSIPPSPQSGSITFIKTTTTPAGVPEVRVTGTFNGSLTASIVVTANGVTKTCTLGLTSSEAWPVCP